MLLPVALALTALTSPLPVQDTWQVGAVAPHIHLPEISTGEAIDLADFRGQKVLIAEFASW
ncbi:MAG: hypothetical protein ACI8QC_002312 [Planctomycetota bacterium]|jgi:hypothetical protein